MIIPRSLLLVKVGLETAYNEIVKEEGHLYYLVQEAGKQKDGRGLV